MKLWVNYVECTEKKVMTSSWHAGTGYNLMEWGQQIGICWDFNSDKKVFPKMFQALDMHEEELARLRCCCSGWLWRGMLGLCWAHLGFAAALFFINGGHRGTPWKALPDPINEGRKNSSAHSEETSKAYVCEGAEPGSRMRSEFVSFGIAYGYKHPYHLRLPECASSKL